MSKIIILIKIYIYKIVLHLLDLLLKMENKNLSGIYIIIFEEIKFNFIQILK